MRINKAVILAAGEGTRLRPLTYSRPKPLLPVAGRPLLDWIISAIAEAGIEQVCVVVGPHSRRAIAEYVGGGERWGVSVCFAVQDPPLGLAHATSMAREFAGDDPFLLYLGDDLFEEPLEEFVGAFGEGSAEASLIVKPVDDPSHFGIVECEGTRVVRLVEKPKEPASDLAIVGVYAFKPSIFNAIDAIEPSARGELEITDAIQYVANHFGLVTVQVTDGYWQDMGRPVTTLEANRLLIGRMPTVMAGSLVGENELTGHVVIAPGAKVEACRLIGPVLICSDAELTSCTIGPNVTVGEGCRFEGVTISESVVLEHSVIRGFGGGIKGSIIGAHSHLHGADGVALEDALLADRSRLDIQTP